MSQFVRFTIDGTECMATRGQFLVDAARENGVFIPTLCNYPGVKPKGSCRVCTVKVNGKLMTACTTPVAEGMNVENDSKDVNELRKSIVELLFIEGNHFCPACEKSGNCELQALAYRFRMIVPRFPFHFPVRVVDATHPRIIKDHNRCILCKRCMSAITDETGQQHICLPQTQQQCRSCNGSKTRKTAYRRTGTKSHGRLSCRLHPG